MTDVKGEVVVCAPFRDREFLLLKRAPHKSSNGKWEFPGGRIEEDEDAEAAAVRELREEIGIQADPVRGGESYLAEAELGTWRCHPFLFEIESEPELSDEHVDSRWTNKKRIFELDTISENQALPALGFKQSPQRTVKAVTRLQDTGEHLLLKRSADRCRCPGLWESPGGLIEEGEEPREAALRELMEETGLEGDIEDSHQPARTTSIHGQFKVYPFLVGVDSRGVELSGEHMDYSWVEGGDPDDRSTVPGYDREVGAFR